MADDRGSAEGGTGGEGTRARRVLTGIAPRAWEHPADKAALQALRRLPVFDEVLRKLFGFFGEKPVRLAFQANAVRVSPNQFRRVNELYEDVLKTMDAPKRYPLFVSQTPMVNAGAYGMDEPFIILNSGTVALLDDDELSFVLGHELGHIMSDHVLYRTMTILLIQLAQMGFPVVGLAARAVLVALLEWYRKSELSSDRAGLLSVQDPQIAMRTMLKMAGGGDASQTSLNEFIQQAEEYRESGDVADQVFKILNLLGTTHPFFVLRVSEIRGWIETGAYDRLLRGDYPRRGEPDRAYEEDLREAAAAYAEGARDIIDHMAGAAKRVGESFMSGFRKQGFASKRTAAPARRNAGPPTSAGGPVSSYNEHIPRTELPVLPCDWIAALERYESPWPAKLWVPPPPRSPRSSGRGGASSGGSWSGGGCAGRSRPMTGRETRRWRGWARQPGELESTFPISPSWAPRSRVWWRGPSNWARPRRSSRATRPHRNSCGGRKWRVSTISGKCSMT